MSLQDYYAGFAIENVVPAHSTYVEEEFDLALAGLVALLIVLFVGAISFLVLCCCLKHWYVTACEHVIEMKPIHTTCISSSSPRTISIPTETRRKDALIKKQIVEDLSTTENPLWIEQYVLFNLLDSGLYFIKLNGFNSRKLKLYEEQELTMQVFSEPDMMSQVVDTVASQPASVILMDRRNSYELASQIDDNTYATIQPRHHLVAASHHIGGGGGSSGGGGGGGGGVGAEIADYATLRNNNSRAPSVI